VTGSGSQNLDFVDKQPVEGPRLADRLAEGPLSADEALQYALDIGAGLNKAHAKGAVHGCLSPYSVRLTANGAVVMAPPLHPGVETAPYRSPEQVRGEQPDSRSDIFSFGALLYEMAAGTQAFLGEGQELNRSILEDPAPTLTLRSPIYTAMASVIAGCLEKNPASRRQRIQNAVIELRFASKAGGRPAGSPIPRLKPPTPAAAPPPDTGTPTPEVASPDEAPASEASLAIPLAAVPPPKPGPGRRIPPAAPRAEQFFFKTGEPVLRARAEFKPTSWRELFQGNGQLSLNAFRVRLVVSIALCLIVVVGVAVGAVLYFRPRNAPPVVKFAVNAPEHTSFPGSPAVSPDGRNLAFSAQGPEGKRTLWLRPLDALRSTPISGTEGGTNPFWSPDGQSLAYFAARSLRIVRLKDNATETVCPVEGLNGGGTWSKDGTIVFARGQDDGLYKVTAKAGSTPFPVLRVNSNKGETGYLWPRFLPDGKHFLFFVQTDAVETTGVYGGSTDAPDYRLLFASETNAVYSALPDAAQKNGYLLFISGRKLMGQGFNAPKMGLAGEPMTLADDIGAVRSLSLAPISVADNATLVYQSTGKATRQMVWVDRGGNELTEVRDAGDWGPPRVAPDGKRAVAAKLGVDGESADLWLIDTDGATTQLTNTSAHEGSPVWSPDGSKIASFVNGKTEGTYDLYVRPVEIGAKPDLLFRSTFPKYPTDWSRDGRYIFFNAMSETTKLDTWAVSTADRHAGALLDTVNAEGHAVLSGDGKWLAFDSDDSGRIEVYVEAFDGINSTAKKRWKISTGGGGIPKWRADGKELFYITASGRVMASAVHPSGEEFDFDPPVKLFQTRPIPKTWNLFDPSPDGQKFLVNLPLEWATSSQIMVVTNWTEKLKD
jgi:Tol biopolymer transport system component